MAVDVVTLAALTAKLIGIGLSTLKASETPGWGRDEAEAFKGLFESAPELKALIPQRAGAAPFVAYTELVTVAFGEAWRRHWLYDERLAPSLGRSKWRSWFQGKSTRERLQQVQQRLQRGNFVAALPGEGNARLDLELADYCESALGSPWYRALWQAFNEPSGDDDESDDMPPLLILEHGGEDRREFERHFRLAFREVLTTPRGRPVVEWLHGRSDERGYLIRELLAAKLSSFRGEHIFGKAGEESGLPPLSLEGNYVEPNAKIGRRRHAPGSDGPPVPVLGLIEELLQRAETRVIVVAADFGRGKSLTARTLAYRTAERFLSRTDRPTPDLTYPIFVRCHEALIKRSLDAESTIRRGQKHLASFLPHADATDEALGLPARQATLVIIDGLDEVQLSGPEASDFFTDLLDRANEHRRFVVFSRPAAVPHEVLERDGVTLVELLDFSTEGKRIGDGSARPSQVESWLDAWSRVATAPAPSLEELTTHDLLELCAIPVLLFMVAHTWEAVHKREHVTRAQLYGRFMLVILHSKLEHDRGRHPVVYQATKKLFERLVTRGDLPSDAPPEAALLELLSRVAWKAHALQQSTDQPLTTLHIKNIIHDLGLSGDGLELAERGLLLTLSVSLSDAEREVHFAHKSFREFLVAKYWESRLVRIVRARPKDRQAIEQQLYGARLLQRGDESVLFLFDQCRDWPEQRDRDDLVEWACDTFEDETLSADTLRKDVRHMLREAALAIGSELSVTGLQPKTQTLASLLASFYAVGSEPIVRAPKLRAEQLVLPGACLRFAELGKALFTGAELERADILEANLSHSDLSFADLKFADLEFANLEFANLSGANLSGANLSGANLSGADLSDATLCYADLSDANLRGTNLEGANLRDAALCYANLSGVDLRGADLSYVQISDTDLSETDQSKAGVCNPDLSRPLLTDSCYDARTALPSYIDPEATGMYTFD